MSKILNQKISEVEHHISGLKKLAEKHFNKKKFEPYKAVCDSILEHEKKLAQLKKELGAETNLKVVMLCRTERFQLRRLKSYAKAH